MAIPRNDPLSLLVQGVVQAFPARGIPTEKLREGTTVSHAKQHKTGGADPLPAGDIGAAPAAHSHPATHDLFIYPSQTAHDAILDDWPHTAAADADVGAAFIWHVPATFTLLNSVNIVMIPDATETIQADIDVSVAAVGEDYNADTRQSLNVTLDVTVSDITEWDISDIGTLFDDIAAGDYIAIRFQSDTDTLRILGLRVSYET